jgi:hypothetical protein
MDTPAANTPPVLAGGGGFSAHMGSPVHVRDVLTKVPHCIVVVLLQ